MTVPHGMIRRKLTAAQYAKARAAGLTDANMQEDGFDLPDSATVTPPAVASQRPSDPAEAAAYDRASRYAKNYGMTDSALRAAAFGFGDEIRSALGAAKDAVTGTGDFGPSYRGRMAAEREGIDRFAQEHPGQNLAAQVAGGVAGAMGEGGALVGRLAGKGAGLLNAARTGAVYGAVTGAGEGEGAEGRLAGAAKGGVVGGIAGTAMSGLGSLGRAVWRRLTTSAADRAGERANTLILDRLQQAELSPSQVAREAVESRATEKPDAFLDLAGDPTRRLARDVTAFPTKGSANVTRFVSERMADQPERMVKDLATHGGITPINTPEAVAALSAEEEKLAKPMYDAIRQVKVQSPALTRLFELPDVQKAYGMAQKVAARYHAVGEGDLLPDLEELIPNAGTAVVRGSEAGANTGSGVTMTMGTLDQVKRALDDVIYSGKSLVGPGGMGPADLASLKRVRDAIRLIGDDATRRGDGTSLYAEARKVWEGPHRLIEQLQNAGSQFMAPKTTVNEKAAQLQKLNPAERGAFKASVLDAVSNRLDNVRSGRDVSAVLDSPNMLNKLRLLFDSPESFDQWRTTFLKERGYGATRNAIASGSRTTPMAAGAAEIAGDPDLMMAGAQSVMTGRATPLASLVARRLLAAKAGVRSKAVADALATRLTTEASDPEAFAALVRELEGTAAQRAARAHSSVAVSRTVGALTGMLTR